MGIFDTILNIGTIFGKVCQTISGAVSDTVSTEYGDYIVRAGKAEVNGVRFTEIIKDGVSTLTAFNTDPDKYACVSYPNGYGKVGGDQVFIPMGQTVPLNVKNWNNISTDIPFHVQKIDLQSGEKAENNRVVIVFRQLHLDGTELNVGDATLSFENGMLKVYYARAGLDALIMADMTSENGIHAVLRDPIEAQKPEQAVTEYEIDISMLGFTKEDTINGMLQFGLTAASVQELKRFADANAKKYNYAAINRYMCDLCGISK